MDHEPRHCSRESAEDLPYDNHSGSRLVLLLLLIPLAAFGGWTAYSVAREIGMALLDPVSAQRISYVAGGAAMLAVVLAILRWQTALSPRAQAEADEEIDEMDEHDDDDDDDYDD
jgi:hypothetical protein